MCGIVGYLGPLNPKDVIIQGLKKLEYRGYDSAGIAVIHNGITTRVRAEGKLKALEEKLSLENISGHIGIGHTRWATHGAPSERNAHPHQVNGVSIVHNGIIENYQEIRSNLMSEGAQITSDTDSELVAHLLAKEVKNTQDLLKAVQNTLPHLKGAFSIVAIWEGQPTTLVAFKDGPPLVVGIHPEHGFVASDVQALLQYTKEFVYLQDREIVKIQNGITAFYNVNGVLLKKEPTLVKWSPDLVEKQGFAHFMLKEIYEQPHSVADAIKAHIKLSSHEICLTELGFENKTGLSDWENTKAIFKKLEHVYIVACGTSFYAAQVGKYLIENFAGLSVEIDVASEFRYRNPIFRQNSLLMVISQSGETADTLAALRLANEKGLLTLSLCNVKGSSIDREAQAHLYMNCGPEVGVASTKAFTSTLAVLNLFALALAKAKARLPHEEERKHVESLLALPSLMETVLNYDKYFKEAANKLKLFKGFLYMGRGPSFPIALEGALKMKELAYLHAEGYPAGEMKHGPLALIDSQMAIVMIIPKDQWYEKTLSNLEEARARGGKIIALGTQDEAKIKDLCELYLYVPETRWNLSPLVSVIPLQLMAYHLSLHLGHDVDQPRNLAKSVTVE